MAVSTCLLLTVVLSCVCGQLEWERLNDGVGIAPSARGSMGIGYDPGTNKIILFGGSPGPMNDTWIYDLTTNIWREVIVNGPAPEARFSMVSGASNSFFYISTGEGANKVFFNDIWRFNIVAEIWEKLPAPEGVAPEVRYGGVGGIFAEGGDEFYVNMGFAAVRYPNTYTYNLAEQKWRLDNCGNCNDYDPTHPHSRCLHTGTMISKDEFILFGGCSGGGGTGGPCPAGDSWRYNGKSKTWKRLPNCAAPRTYGAMAMLPSSLSKKRVVMYGGGDKSKSVIHTEGIQTDQVAVFDPDTDEWTIRKTSAPSNNYPSKRNKAGMTKAPNGVFMFGGISSTAMNDLWILKGTADNVDDGEKVDCKSNFIDYITIHGIFMVAGWGALLQWGAFIARYMKFKDPLWFNLHRGFQVSGLVLSICGLAFAVVSVPFDHLKFPHAIIGVIVMILGIIQPINAVIRPHKSPVGQEKSLRRKIWEFIHLNCGRTALVLALINISLGVLLSITAIQNWIIWFVYLAILVLAYIIAEVLKCIKEKKSDKSDSFNLEPKT